MSLGYQSGWTASGSQRFVGNLFEVQDDAAFGQGGLKLLFPAFGHGEHPGLRTEAEKSVVVALLGAGAFVQVFGHAESSRFQDLDEFGVFDDVIRRGDQGFGIIGRLTFRCKALPECDFVFHHAYSGISMPTVILRTVGNRFRSISRVMVRATNWLGDAVMSLPALRVIREAFPGAHLAVVARPWVADLYARERSIDRVILYPVGKGFRAKREFAFGLREERFDAAILLQNAFEAALVAWMAEIPERISYSRDGRRWLLTRAVPPPEPGEIPRHERFYYLELLRRAGLMERLPRCDAIRLDGIDAARK